MLDDEVVHQDTFTGLLICDICHEPVHVRPWHRLGGYYAHDNGTAGHNQGIVNGCVFVHFEDCGKCSQHIHMLGRGQI